MNLPYLKKHQYTEGFEVDGIFVDSTVAELIAFAKLRASKLLTDLRLAKYVTAEMKEKNEGEHQWEPTFIQRIFEHMEERGHPFMEKPFVSHRFYEVDEAPAVAEVIQQIQKDLWEHVAIHSLNQSIVAQVLVQYLYGDKRKLSQLVCALEGTIIPNSNLVEMAQHQKDFTLPLYQAVTQAPKATLRFWKEDQTGLMENVMRTEDADIDEDTDEDTDADIDEDTDEDTDAVHEDQE